MAQNGVDLKKDEKQGLFSGVVNWCYGIGRKVSRAVLSQGPLPKHIAIIMDGNRRFAQKCNMEKENGHTFGFNALKETLRWSLELGVSSVTVYAFSIENFKRPKVEVDTLMNLAYDHLHSLLQEEELIQQHGVRIRALGNLSLLPPHVQYALGKAVHTTRNNTKSTLNVAISYTSREEMLHAASTLAQAVHDNTLQPNDITEDLYEKCMYMDEEPDILIRTSGEIRLSDFLLWQCSYSPVVFFNVLWPEFSWMHLYYTILLYQRNYDKIQERRKAHEQFKIAHQKEVDQAWLKEHKGTSEEAMTDERKKRVDSFLEEKYKVEVAYFEDLCKRDTYPIKP